MTQKRILSLLVSAALLCGLLAGWIVPRFLRWLEGHRAERKK